MTSFVNESVGGCVREYYSGLECLCFFICHGGITHDYDYIARLDTSCCSPVEADDARSGLARYYIGIEAFSVIIVNDIDTFARQYVGSIHEFAVYRYAPDVV